MSKIKYIKSNKAFSSAHQRQGGFTLIELMVSISIFMMIMLVAISSLFIALDASKKARALRYAMDNVNFAMDTISRSLRMGTNYTCDYGNDGIDITSNPPVENCLTPKSTIAFIPQDAKSLDRVAYSLNVDDGIGRVEKCVYDSSLGGSPSCSNLTSPNVDIEELSFSVLGASKIPDTHQARAHIFMRGVVRLPNGEETTFAIQTLASQRNIE